MWSFGSLAGLALVIQIITGVLLAMHYAPEIHLAFTSVEHIMRDVRGGVALRYIHANGASMFFIVVYLHMFRGLYYGSYFQPRANLWYSGIIIFFLMMATAFMGYVLPWGQMSFWGATVITNLFSAIPVVGNQIVQLLWGGFSVDNPTLNRFFSFHYLVPFLIAGMAILHLILLHQNGSNNPLGILGLYDKIPFYPYYYVKDLFAFFIFVWVFSFFVIYAPNYMGHPDNYIEANPLVTPAHIVPEWYFLPFYAVLRTIPDKLGGVVLMVLAIFVLALLPIVDTSVFRSNFFKPLNIWFFWYFFADSLSLGWIGQEIVESPFIEMANFVTSSYFLYFIPMLPLIGFLENAVINYELAIIHKDTYSDKDFNREYSLAMVPSILFVDQLNIEAVENFLNITSLCSWLAVLQLGFITIFLLLLGTRYTRTGEFSVLMNKLAFLYISFNIWMGTEDQIIQSFNDLSSQYTTESNLFLTVFILFASITIVIFFYGIIDRFFIANSYETEYSIIVLLMFLGAIVLLRVDNFIEFIIAIEIVTFSTYILVAYEQQNRFSVYAGVQYFILGSIPSAMLILAISWIYSNYGILGLYELNLITTVHDDFAWKVNQNASFDSEIIGQFKEMEYLEPFKGQSFRNVCLQYLPDLPAPSRPIEPRLDWRLVTPEEIARAKQYYYWTMWWEDARVFASQAIWKADVLYPETRDILVEGKTPLELFAEESRNYLIHLAKYKVDFANHNSTVMAAFNHYFECYNKDIFFVPLDLYLSPTFLHFNWDNVFTSIDFKQHKALAILLFFSYNLLFKLTAAPFHFWALSIYEKAPISSVTLLSIFTKLMIIFLIIKVFFISFFAFKSFITIFYIFISILTAIFAIIGAFITPILKKFFVYSSMGHVAFMLIPLAFFSVGGTAASLHYLAIYVLSSFIMWFIIFIRMRDNHTLLFFKQFKSSDPILGFIFSMLIFSMSGIPPFGGFYVKLDVLTILLEYSNFYIAFILFFCTVASFFYYLRLIKIIYFDNKNNYAHEEILSIERLYLVIVLFLILSFYSILVQIPLLFTEIEFLKLIN